MHNPGGAEANGGSGAQVVVQGIRLGKQSLTTVQDLEVALDAAVHINRHLNRELQSLSEQLSKAEADRHAWEAHAKRLAMQLAQHKLAAAEAGAIHHTSNAPAALRCWLLTGTAGLEAAHNTTCLFCRATIA
jgi:hypothetical protein